MYIDNVIVCCYMFTVTNNTKCHCFSCHNHVSAICLTVRMSCLIYLLTFIYINIVIDIIINLLNVWS